MAVSNLVAERYELGEVIGMGATGQVYQATDQQTKQIVAVKKIPLHKFSKKQVEGFMNEMDLLKSFTHPNIVKFLDYSKTQHDIYFILEFMHNGSLSKTIKSDGAFPEDLLALHISGALKGLCYLHENNIVHRDIKGDNILISRSGRVCLSDFGLAKKVDPDFIPENEAVGTPYWLAPEVILMTEQTTASDIWSLGCTLIELLTGNPPYSNFSSMGAIFHMVQDEHPPIPEGISKKLEDFLLQCFLKDTSLRSTAKKLLQHDWIPREVAEKLDVRTMRSSLRNYNSRRPTITSGALAKSINTQVLEEQEKDKKDLEFVRNQVRVSYHANSPGRTEKLEEVIDKLHNKMETVQRRIIKRQEEEEVLTRLSKIYKPLTNADIENFEMEMKAVQEGLDNDLKTQPTIQKQVLFLKESIYPTAIAKTDSTENSTKNDFLSFSKGDSMFVLSFLDSGKIRAEHMNSGKKGIVFTSQVDISEILDSTKTMEDDFILKQFEEKTLKGRISEISSEDNNNNNKQSRLKKSQSKIRFGRSNSGNTMNDLDKPLSICLLEVHPHLNIEKREFVKQGIFHYWKNQKETRECYLFLFSDLLVITKKKIKKQDDFLFRILGQVLLEEARIILFSDDLIYKNVFQIIYKEVTYTLSPTAKDDIEATKIRNVWYQSIKGIIRGYQLSRVLNKSPRNDSRVGSPPSSSRFFRPGNNSRPVTPSSGSTSPSHDSPIMGRKLGGSWQDPPSKEERKTQSSYI